MGADGCGWVRVGALGRRVHGEHKKSQRGGIFMVSQARIGTYGRGNFPGHDFLWVLPKILKDECRWVMMDKGGCNGVSDHGGEKKQDKKGPKWASVTCFEVYGRGEKKQEVNRDGHGDQRGSRGAIEGEQRVHCTESMCICNKKARKQTGGKRKR